MTYVLITGNKTQTGKQRTLWEDEGLEECIYSQGKPKIANKPAEAREREGRILPWVSDGTWTCKNDLEFQTLEL